MGDTATRRHRPGLCVWLSPWISAADAGGLLIVRADSAYYGLEGNLQAVHDREAICPPAWHRAHDAEYGKWSDCKDRIQETRAVAGEYASDSQIEDICARSRSGA